MPKQKSDQTPDDVEIPMESKEFMDEFFAQVRYMWINYTVSKRISTFECHAFLKIEVPKGGFNSYDQRRTIILGFPKEPLNEQFLIEPFF